MQPETSPAKATRSSLFRNWISLIGGALTSASAFVLIGFWVVAFFGHAGSNNPYVGIVVDLFLPGLFVWGLLVSGRTDTVDS